MKEESRKVEVEEGEQRTDGRITKKALKTEVVVLPGNRSQLPGNIQASFFCRLLSYFFKKVYC